jgi:hypothetical protein
MKTIFVTFFSVIIAFSFSAIALAANHAAPCTVQISKQVMLSNEEPAPAPAPVPEPAPAPEPKPY